MLKDEKDFKKLKYFTPETATELSEQTCPGHLQWEAAPPALCTSAKTYSYVVAQIGQEPFTLPSVASGNNQTFSLFT